MRNIAYWVTVLFLFTFSSVFAQRDSTVANFVNGFNFEGKTRKITFDKNGCPLDYHYITQPDPSLGDPTKVKKHRWQHLQHMIRLPDVNGNQYYMGTFSQNVAGGALCGNQGSIISNGGYSDEANEGGIVFVAELTTGTSSGKVIWCEELNNTHLAGGFNHPGDLRRIGNTVIIAGQNWCPTAESFDNIFGSEFWKGFGKMLAYPLKSGNGEQAVLFYDVSDPVKPAYMGKLNSCLDADGKEYRTTNEIDELTAAKVGEYYYLWFNGYEDKGLACRSKTFHPNSKWELIQVANDLGVSPISFLHEGNYYSGGATVRGDQVAYDRLKFKNNGNWEYDLNALSDSIKREIPVASTSMEIPDLLQNKWEGAVYSINSLSDGRSSVVITNVESANPIEIVEIESDNQYLPPITDVYLVFSKQKSDVPPGYTPIYKDLNKDAGGRDIFLCYKRDPCKEPITAFAVQINNSDAPPNYIPIENAVCGNKPCSVNKGTDDGIFDSNEGEDVFMFYSRSIVEGAPITDLDIMWRPGKGNFWEMTMGDLGDRFDKLAKIFTDFDIEKPLGFVFNVGDALVPTELKLIKNLADSGRELGAIEEAPSQWYRDPNDLNKGAGGYDIWLAYSRTNGISTSFLKCPPNIEVESDPGSCGAHVAIDAPKFRPDCPVESGSVSLFPASGSFFPIGATTVKCQGTDFWNPRNPALFCKFTVTVNDAEKPVVSCPAGFSVQCEKNIPAGNPATATTSDNCGSGVTVTCSQGKLIGTNCYGTVTNTYTATDNNGNTSSCTQLVTVKDETAPVITCPVNTTVTSDTTVAITRLATAVDDCDNQLDFSRYDVQISGDCDWYCIIERYFQAKDDCGNTSSCKQRITRNTAPKIETVLPITLGASNSTVTIPVGRADCIISWLPSTGTVPKGLDFKKVIVSSDCRPGNNQLDINGKQVNPLLTEALKLTIFVRLKPSLGTTKISSLGNCVSPAILNYLAPDPDINELLRVTNMALGNIAVQPHLQKLLEALQCINEPLDVH